jgi:hypothetical protein
MRSAVSCGRPEAVPSRGLSPLPGSGSIRIRSAAGHPQRQHDRARHATPLPGDLGRDRRCERRGGHPWRGREHAPAAQTSPASSIAARARAADVQPSATATTRRSPVTGAVSSAVAVTFSLLSTGRGARSWRGVNPAILAALAAPGLARAWPAVLTCHRTAAGGQPHGGARPKRQARPSWIPWYRSARHQLGFHRLLTGASGASSPAGSKFHRLSCLVQLTSRQPVQEKSGSLLHQDTRRRRRAAPDPG